jgi:hypothetical protein
LFNFIIEFTLDEFEFITVEKPEVGWKYFMFESLAFLFTLGLINSIPSKGVKETLDISLRKIN